MLETSVSNETRCAHERISLVRGTLIYRVDIAVVIVAVCYNGCHRLFYVPSAHLLWFDDDDYYNGGGVCLQGSGVRYKIASRARKRTIFEVPFCLTHAALTSTDLVDLVHHNSCCSLIFSSTEIKFKHEKTKKNATFGGKLPRSTIKFVNRSTTGGDSSGDHQGLYGVRPCRAAVLRPVLGKLLSDSGQQLGH